MRTLTSNEDYSRFDSLNCRESKQVWEFFNQREQGIFVDVGANHPTEQSLTWFLEVKGWSGILIEPNPEMAQLLRKHRPQSRLFQVAIGGPTQVGDVNFYLAGNQSALSPSFDVTPAGVIHVPLRTLDSVLTESGLAQIDFLSIDVEGMELDVLEGFNLAKYQPPLMLIEDHLYHHKVYSYLRRNGYKLVRRTGYNNWYVPAESPISVFTLSTPLELFHLFRKMWFAPPFNKIRRAIRRRKFARRNQNVPFGRPMK